MGKVTRTTVVKLEPFDANWRDSYLTFRVMSWLESNEYNQRIARLTKDLDNEALSLEDSLKVSQATVDMAINMIRERFVKGSIYDAEIGTQRDATVEDLDAFDGEVIRTIIAAIKGSLEKKV